MFSSSRFFNESRFPTRSVFDSDPFFTHPSSSTRVSEEKDYSQHKDDEHATTTHPSRSTEPQTSTPTPPSTADTSQSRGRGRSGVGREHTQLRPYRDPYDQQMMINRWDDDFGNFCRSSFGGMGMMESMMNRMERLMQRVDQVDDTDWSSMPSVGDTGHSSSYSCSSSSFSQSGINGAPDISHTSSRELRRIGDVLEESTHFQDSNGNQRTTNKKGIAKQMKEIITERNGKGEERKVENLRGIQPSEVQQFDQAWQQATDKFDPKHKLLGRTHQQHALPSATQAQIGPSSNEKRDVSVAADKSLGNPPATPPRKNSKSNTTAV